ncbi:MAG: hypothetical protein AB7H97_16290 [Pseudobdellovibrionaceae bacterium]
MSIKIFSATALLLGTLVSLESQAYFSNVETAEVPPPGTYYLSVEPQVVFNTLDQGSKTGLNLVGHFDAPVSDSSSMRVLLGTGTTDFQTGFFFKWVPIPDIDNQPAIGFKFGALYARADDTTQLSARIYPIVSKKYDSSYGLLTPYASLPMGLTNVEKKSYTPVTLALGSEWKPVDMKYVWFGAELGLDMKDAFSYISGVVIFSIDEDEGFRFE